jgi:hypothetical protein
VNMHFFAADDLPVRRRASHLSSQEYLLARRHPPVADVIAAPSDRAAGRGEGGPDGKARRGAAGVV